MQNQPNNLPVKIESCPLNSEFPVHFFEHSPGTHSITTVHVHNFFEVGYCKSGSGIFVIDNKVYPFYQGDVVIIMPNHLHIAQSSSSGSEWYFVYTDIPNLLSNFNMDELITVSSILQNNAVYENITKNEQIAQHVLNIVSLLSNTPIHYKSNTKALFWSLILTIDRELKRDHASQQMDIIHSDIFKLAPVLEYISKNFNKEMNIDLLASLAYMSPTSLRRHFSNIIHMSPLEYIFTIRIKSATILLNTTSKSISDIAYEVGFTTLSSFNRKFKDIMHCSPSEYKRNKPQS